MLFKSFLAQARSLPTIIACYENIKYSQLSLGLFLVLQINAVNKLRKE